MQTIVKRRIATFAILLAKFRFFHHLQDLLHDQVIMGPDLIC